MPRIFNGTSDKAVYAGSMIPAYPYTLACWFYPTDTNNFGILLGASNTGSNNQLVCLRYRGIDPGDPIDLGIRDDAAAVAENLVTGNGVNLNAWNLAIGVCASASSRTVYLNNGTPVVSSTAVGTLTLNITTIGVLSRLTDSQFFAGKIGAAAVWSAALDGTDAANLWAGAHMGAIRTVNLVDLWLMAGFGSPEPSLVSGGHSLTLTGTTADTSSNPPVWAPWRPPMPIIGAA
jgi:hypothetical protein